MIRLEPMLNMLECTVCWDMYTYSFLCTLLKIAIQSGPARFFKIPGFTRLACFNSTTWPLWYRKIGVVVQNCRTVPPVDQTEETCTDGLLQLPKGSVCKSQVYQNYSVI